MNLQLPQQTLNVDYIAAGAPMQPLFETAAVQPLFETAEGLETPIQLIYLSALLGFLAFGAYLVVRQVLIRRELDEAAKALGERIRTGEATCEVRSQRCLSNQLAVSSLEIVIYGSKEEVEAA